MRPVHLISPPHVADPQVMLRHRRNPGKALGNLKASGSQDLAPISMKCAAQKLSENGRSC